MDTTDMAVLDGASGERATNRSSINLKHQKRHRMANPSPIEQVVVLMLENHTFDKMLGFLKKGEGLTG